MQCSSSTGVFVNQLSRNELYVDTNYSICYLLETTDSFHYEICYPENATTKLMWTEMVYADIFGIADHQISTDARHKITSLCQSNVWLHWSTWVHLHGFVWNIPTQKKECSEQQDDLMYIKCLRAIMMTCPSKTSLAASFKIWGF